MRQYIKPFLFRALCGAIIGLAIGHTVYLIFALNGRTLTVEPRDIMLNYVATLLVGFWCAGISIVYDIDEWSLLRQTISHGILLVPYIPFAFYMGWAPASALGRVIYVFIYILVYVIIWLSFKAYWKKRASEINERLVQINGIDDDTQEIKR